MNALRWTAINEMDWEDAADMGAHPSGWVQVDTLMVGICGSEIAAYLGHNELRRPPLVMGHEFSARLTVDLPTQNLVAGDLVTVNPLVSCGRCRACLSGNRQRCLDRKIIGIDFSGGFAERVFVPERQCYKVNEATHGALVEPLACAIRAVNQGAVEKGDEVVVIGAGIIGLMSALGAKAQGARKVAIIDPNARRLRDGLSWGATDLIEANDEDVLTEVSKLMPDGADRVIDAVGFGTTRTHSLQMVRRGGRVVWIGLHENLSSIPGNAVVRDETEIVGSFCYTDDEFRRAVDLANMGFTKRPGAWLDVRPVVAGKVAFAEQARGPAPFAKILLAFD